MRVIIVGAGLAGLTCAKVLSERGAQVVVFEASDGVGGRIRSDEKEGFLLDRGFQVYFTAYPVARRHLDHDGLDFRSFDPGAIICRGREKTILSDPLRDPKALGPSRLSERYIGSFYRPFYGGVFLHRSLYTSSRAFRFTFRMLATGRTVVPARGMGEIPRQIAAHLPEGAVRLNSPVDRLLREYDSVVGVRAEGEEHEADAVVVATEAPVAGELTGEAAPEGSVGEVCLYYETSGLGSGRKVLLNAAEDAFVNNAVEISNVSERYAPDGRHLLYAVALTGLDSPDAELYRRGVENLSSWYPEVDLRPLALRRIPYGQFAQPPGIHETLPPNRAATPGLFLAGEYTEDASINGSMLSGEKAAGEVLGA